VWALSSKFASANLILDYDSRKVAEPQTKIRLSAFYTLRGLRGETKAHKTTKGITSTEKT
jgi:hypothetical protein